MGSDRSATVPAASTRRSSVGPTPQNVDVYLDGQRQFGYDVDTVGWQSFMTENIGGGIKIFRASDAPNWGFRVDYRMLFINSKSGAPAFFAQSKSRTASRVYVGMLYTWKR